MQFGCINLKYLAFFVLLSLSWMVPSTYALNIQSSGTPLFRHATNGLPFAGFKSTDYNMPGPGNPSHTFSAADAIVQIKWGIPAYPSITENVSAYILYPFPETGTTPVTLGKEFQVATLEHVNRPINYLSITDFTMQLSLNLSINNISLPSIVYNDIVVTHDETLNPAADIATWKGGSQDTREFTFAGKTYTFTLLGIPSSYDPSCPGQCFLTEEWSSNNAPIMAVINGTVPIPEPSTYLILSSMIGMILYYQYLASKKMHQKAEVSIRQDKEENTK